MRTVKAARKEKRATSIGFHGNIVEVRFYSYSYDDDHDDVTQDIPTSQNPTRWESDIMMKGGNMTQSNSHRIDI